MPTVEEERAYRSRVNNARGVRSMFAAVAFGLVAWGADYASDITKSNVDTTEYEAVGRTVIKSGGPEERHNVVSGGLVLAEIFLIVGAVGAAGNGGMRFNNARRYRNGRRDERISPRQVSDPHSLEHPKF